jgi:diguanylate cyclase (GGDEF)-like protein/PAS domain S-box-containing protein
MEPSAVTGGPRAFELKAETLATLLDEVQDAVYVLDAARRIVFWNRAAERLTGFAAGDVVGRACGDDILSHVDGGGCALCAGSCPASVTLRGGGSSETELYLHHRAGHRLGVSVRTVPLRDAAGEVIGVAEIFRETTPVNTLRAEAESLRRMALLDPGTEVGNRRLLDMALQQAVLEGAPPVGVLFIDVDGFKRVNDEHGHEVGDAVLRMAAKTLGGVLRAHDLVGRWGGDEFMVIVRDIDTRSLAVVADKLRVMVESAFLEHRGKRVSITVSVGGVVKHAGESVADLIARADARLYESKRAGRNCVRIDPGERPAPVAAEVAPDAALALTPAGEVA